VSRDGAGLGGKTSQLNYSQYLFVVHADLHSVPVGDFNDTMDTFQCE
jgi:hypothetical protein